MQHPGPPVPPGPNDITQRMRPVRIDHELYLAYTLHGQDPLELTEIGDAVAAFVTRQAAGRATVRNKTQITGPIRSTSRGDP